MMKFDPVTDPALQDRFPYLLIHKLLPVRSRPFRDQSITRACTPPQWAFRRRHHAVGRSLRCFLPTVLGSTIMMGKRYRRREGGRGC
jgi:hypothetical protein